MRDGEYPVNYLGVERRKRDGKKWTDVNESLLYSFAPCLIDTLDSAFAGHVIEQLEHNRLIRPRARYTGPEVRPVKTLAERNQ